MFSVFSNLISPFAGIPHGVACTCTLAAGAIVAGTVELVERRNRNTPLHPGRQIELATLIESMPEAVFVIDENGLVVESNQSAERLTCMSKAALRDLPGDDVVRYVADPQGLPADKTQFAIYRALRGESVLQERRQISRSGAGMLEVLISANPIRQQDGRIVGALVIVRDITELAGLQQHVAKTERQSAIGAMAASLTHDFNNVLDTISQAATVLEITPDRAPAERAVVLRMIQNAVKRGSEIVDNVRQFLVGSQAGCDSLDMNTLLEETLELTRPMWQASRVSLVRQFQPVPRVRFNAAEMRRVFTNLIINALEAMPKGGTLIVGCEHSRDTVRAFVADTGEGIPPERCEKLFVPYFTTKQHGTGLGLSSALRAVRAQRGDITFTSKIGEGSRFIVELPAVESGQRAA
jgi:PAS domain S-box-containing protein